MGKFLSQKDMANLKKEIAIYNSKVKRGDIIPSNTQDIVRWSCGCCYDVVDIK